MVALSIRQPWAWLIANGHKDVENRSWRTSYHGPLLIHASMHKDRASYEAAVKFATQWCGVPEGAVPPFLDLNYGGVVGVAYLDEVVDHSRSPWFTGPKGLVLSGARPVGFLECKGRLQLFNVALTAEQEDAVMAALRVQPEREVAQ